MDKLFLTINLGSASKKYALYQGEKRIASAHFETDINEYKVAYQADSVSENIVVTASQYDEAIRLFIEWLKSKEKIHVVEDVAAIGIRIVSPGVYFLSTRRIDENFVEELLRAREHAPIHIGEAIHEIKFLRHSYPQITLIGISDSAFHKGLPKHARYFGLPREDAAKFGVYRFGYHGLSAKSVLNQAQKLLGTLPPKIVVCHLGSGTSVIMIKNGESQDTSMGYTPLEGVPMRTRVGSIDPGAVLFLAKRLGLTIDRLDEYFNRKCGLLGLSGTTGDVYKLLLAEKNGDQLAAETLEIFIYQVRKYLCSFAGLLNGIDLVIFTGTIGEKSAEIRERICGNLSVFGIELDFEKNKQYAAGGAFLESGKYPVKIAVLETDEVAVMIEEMGAFLQSGK
ncbi:hypothetical protein M1271_01080 [Patescibacteria group bacterium]|nr:hypothetical protein [Patescibacteria group bacterium]